MVSGSAGLMSSNGEKPAFESECGITRRYGKAFRLHSLRSKDLFLKALPERCGIRHSAPLILQEVAG